MPFSKKRFTLISRGIPRISISIYQLPVISPTSTDYHVYSYLLLINELINVLASKVSP